MFKTKTGKNNKGTNIEMILQKYEHLFNADNKINGIYVSSESTHDISVCPVVHPKRCLDSPDHHESRQGVRLSADQRIDFLSNKCIPSDHKWRGRETDKRFIDFHSNIEKTPDSWIDLGQ